MIKFGEDCEDLASVPTHLDVGGHTYAVLQQLHKTQHTAVYLAHDSQSRVPQVVKMYWNSDFALRAGASYRLIQQFRHHFAGIMPDIIEQSESYQISQFCSGPDLELYFQYPRVANEIHHIALDLADKIGVLLKLGLVHSDIKPANILLPFPWRGDHTATSIIDFDFLVRPGSRALRTGMNIFGTPYFAAPEQCAGDATLTTDVYSFGIMLYVLLGERYNLPLIFGHIDMSVRNLLLLRSRPYYFSPQEFVSKIAQHIQSRSSPSPEEMKSILVLLECIAYCTRYDPELRPETGEQIRKILLRSPSI